MKRILITCTILVSFTLKSQKTGTDPEVNLLVNSVSSDSLRSYVEKLVRFGTRHTMSSTSDPVKGIGAARSWVLSKFRTYAANSDGRMHVYLQNQDVRPDGKRISRRTSLGNPVALLKGTDPSDKRIFIIGAHLDSRASDVMDWQTAAPGANDDGSGVAAVIESARIYLPVKHRQLYHFPKTISCLLFRAFRNQAILACL